MKVILLEDVKSIGKKGEIAEVSDAYARNVLLRKHQALEATGRNMNDLKLQKANQEKVAAENLAAAQELKKKLDASQITLRVKVGDGGRLFGSISTKEISEAVKEQLGYDIDKKKIQLAAPVKATGQIVAAVKLHTKVTADLKVNVESL